MKFFTQLPIDTQMNIERLLHENDLNQNGLIEGHELRNILNILGMNLTEEDFHDAMVQIDTDNNNVLDMEECKEFFALCYLEAQD
ncbi:polcalcin [Acrasis kona]|uniref:Polcalcin n=1 Tax=Acrasis kona TaxID=1008807 RepID=A0AAW2Z436_9EUKA